MKIQNGFTLVELAIVMVIIGVLLGGVLKGQELITNAKASATVADIKNYEAAVNTFQDAYDELPGDMPNPNTRLPNCVEPGGTVGQSACSSTMAPATLAWVSLGDGRVGRPGAYGPGDYPVFEGIAFFPQLAAADLIGKINSQARLADAYVWSGRVFPETSVGGGFGIGWSDGTTAMNFDGIIGGMTPDTPRRGLYLILHNNPGYAVSAPYAGTVEIIQPSHALRIDNKIDDGSPYTGFVRGGGTVGNADSNCATATDYNGRSTQPVCYLYIRLGG